ncbi:MAG: hypothetical protein MI673_03110 [Thiotrichales bacterium]|nr:hypothetical protein [Thiotrichales bacterium]
MNPKITMVKKILQDGSPCKKCAEVEQRLTAAGMLDRIDETVIADERDHDSPGMQLAREYQVDRAPFFIVEHEGKSPEIYTVYFKLLKEVLEARNP